MERCVFKLFSEKQLKNGKMQAAKSNLKLCQAKMFWKTAGTYASLIYLCLQNYFFLSSSFRSNASKK